MAAHPIRLIRAAAATLAALLLAGASCEAEGNAHQPVVLVVIADDRETTHELRLGGADLDALGLPPGPMAEDFDRFRLETSFTDTEDLPFRYCLEEDATVVATPSGAVDGEIPAGTCLESGGILRVDLERSDD